MPINGKSHLVKVVALTATIFVIVGGGLTYLLTRTNPSSTTQISQTSVTQITIIPTLIPLPTPTTISVPTSTPIPIDPYAGWSTYSNSKNGFSLKYPINLNYLDSGYVATQDYIFIGNSTQIDFLKNTKGGMDRGIQLANIQINVDSNSQDDIQSDLYEKVTTRNFKIGLISAKEFTITRIKANDQAMSDGLNIGDSYKVVHFTHNNKSYGIREYINGNYSDLQKLIDNVKFV